MKAKELKEKSKEGLMKILEEKRGASAKFKFDLNLGRNKNVKQGGALKKDIARILTVINQK